MSLQREDFPVVGGGQRYSSVGLGIVVVYCRQNYRYRAHVDADAVLLLWSVSLSSSSPSFIVVIAAAAVVVAVTVVFGVFVVVVFVVVVVNTIAVSPPPSWSLLLLSSSCSSSSSSSSSSFCRCQSHRPFRHSVIPSFGPSFVRRSSFVVRRSSFVVCRSSFVVRRSSFVVWIETVGLLAVGSFCRTNLTLTESRKRQRWIEQTNAFTLYPVVRCSTRTTQLARVIPTELPRPIPHKTTFPECRSSACIYNMECSPECR